MHEIFRRFSGLAKFLIGCEEVTIQKRKNLRIGLVAIHYCTNDLNGSH
jgi:hypothetical protein